MLSWALKFLVAAVAATVIAAAEISPAAAAMAKIGAVVLLALCTVSLVAALRRGRTK